MRVTNQLTHLLLVLFSRPNASLKLLQKLLPVVHLIAGWALLAYFVMWKEPQAFEAQPHTSAAEGSAWRRWAELGWRRPEDVWGVQFVVSAAYNRKWSDVNPFT